MIRGDAISIGDLTDIMQPYAGGTAFVGILDNLPSTTAAYSVRRLLTSYVANKAVNIRRSSDNTTQDIGFTASGAFDATSFSSFIGGGSGFVTKWYDQSGNGNDASQATAAKQPQLQLSQINSKAALTPSAASSQALVTSTTSPFSFTPTSGFTVIGPFKTTQAAQWTLATNLNAAASLGWQIFASAAGKIGFFDGASAPVGSVAINDGNAHLVGVLVNSVAGAATIQTYEDGTTDASQSAGAAIAASSTGLQIFGFDAGSTQYATGTFPELVIFTSQLSSGNLSTYRTNTQSEYGTA